MRHRFVLGVALWLLSGIGLQAWAAGYPAAFAAEVALYPGGRVLQSHQDADGQHVDLLVADAPAKVVDYYTRQMTAHGWRLKNRQALGPIAAADLRRDGKRMVISVLQEQDKVVATLTLTTP